MYFKHPINDLGNYRVIECESVSHAMVKGADWLADNHDFRWLFSETAAGGWEIPLDPQKHPIVAGEIYEACGVSVREGCGHAILIPRGMSFIMNAQGATVERI